MIALLAAATLQVVASLPDVPVGIAVSRDATPRVFISGARAIAPMSPLSVAELKDGKPVAYPPGFQQDKGECTQTRLVSVQALYVDAGGALWILDSCKVGQEPIKAGSPKLIRVDLATNRAVRTYPISVAGTSAFINDVRIDQKQQRAYFSDTSFEGPNGIVVLDLQSGESWRKLDNDASVKAEEGFIEHVENQPLLKKDGKPFKGGIDGIALAGDAFYYSPLTGHRLFRVRTQDLERAGTPKPELLTKDFASDGLLEGADGRLFATDPEHNAVQARDPKSGAWTIVAQDPRMLWPDSMAQAQDGTLYFTCTQIERGTMAKSSDQRIRPFHVFSIATR